MIATSSAIAAIDPRLLLVGRSLGGPPLEVARTITGLLGVTIDHLARRALA